MAHFSNCGAHCAHAYCHQKDFLPLTCDGCQKSFCSEHFKYEAHGCTEAAQAKDKRVIVCPVCQQSLQHPAGADENSICEAHLASECKGSAPLKPKCPVQGCKEKLTALNKFCCGSCKVTVCMKHRFEDSHNCQGLAVSKSSRAGTAATSRLAGSCSGAARRTEAQPRSFFQRSVRA